MIIATIRIVADSENIDKIIEILASVKGQVAGKTGCISCLILQEVNNENRISYEELWENQEQFNKHIRSNLYQKILVAIDMSSQPPIVKFSTISSVTGMELLRECLPVRQESTLEV
ncbi:MAG: antibiotic biosynthesis monooxygenase [Deltaproteobacteria bacterium]|nr:antibiotic biosynthesis monooxygenase [Deltaproteobacteria bacterium]